MAERAARAESTARGGNAARQGVPPSETVPVGFSASPVEASVERLRSEAALWPWIGRFFWSPALDLHPSRRASLLSGWPAEIWSDPRALEHISRHLLSSHGLLATISYDSAASDFLLVLLPQTPLARLARL